MQYKLIFDHLQKMDKALTDKIWSDDSIVTMLVEVGMALGAIFALFMVARVVYRSLSGREPIDFLSFGKPALIALLLSNWLLVSQFIFGITQPLENMMKAGYENRIEVIDSLRVVRNTKNFALIDRKREMQAAGEAAAILTADDGAKEDSGKAETDKTVDSTDENQEDEFFPEKYVPGVESAMQVVSDTRFGDSLNALIFWIGEVFWEGAVYFVFLAKYIFMAVLVLFGPITFAASILPVWSSSWKDWVERAVSVSLYGTVAYFCMTTATFIIQYALMADIRAAEYYLSTDNAFMSYIKMGASGGIGTSLLYVIAMFAGAALISTVPELSTWVWPSQKIRSAQGFINGVQSVIRETALMAAKATVVAVTGGAAAGAVGGGGGAAASEGAGSVGVGPLPGGSGESVSGDGGGLFAHSDGILDNVSSTTAGQDDVLSSEVSSTGQAFGDRSWLTKALDNQEELARIAQLLETFEEAEEDGRLEALLDEIATRHKVMSEGGVAKRPLIEKMERCFIDVRHDETDRRLLMDELDQLLQRYNTYSCRENGHPEQVSENGENIIGWGGDLEKIRDRFGKKRENLSVPNTDLRKHPFLEALENRYMHSIHELRSREDLLRALDELIRKYDNKDTVDEK